MSAYREAAPELGPLLQEFKPSRLGIRALFGFMIGFGLLVDGSALIVGLSAMGGPLPLLFLGAVVPGLGVLGLTSTGPDLLRVHQNGLVVGQREVVLYDQILEVSTLRILSQSRGQATPIADRHFLRTSDGRVVEVRCFGAGLVESVLDHIRGATRERLVHDAREKQSLQFGELTMDDSGVRTEDASLSWSSISGASFEAASVIIRGPGSAWIELDLDKVPNAHVLVALVNERARAG